MGGNINFHQLSMLASAMSNRMTMVVKPSPSAMVGEEDGQFAHKNVRDKQAWQILLRKYEVEKTNETLREEQQKQEDSHLRANYFVHADATVELADAVIKTSVTEEMPFVENHIIIIGE